MHVSAKGKKVIQQMAKGEKVSFENSGLSKREWNELMISFNFDDRPLDSLSILTISLNPLIID